MSSDADAMRKVADVRREGRESVEVVDGEEALRLALASGAVAKIRHAIDGWGAHVRSTAASDDEREVLAEALVPLAAHPEPRIRQSVADAADALPEGAFDALLARFPSDEDQYVRTAIARAAKRRATQRKVRAKEGEQEKGLADLLAEIERKHGPGARLLAERAVRRGTEYFVRRLHHEVTKIVLPLQYQLARLRSDLAERDIDRGSLTRNVTGAWGRLTQLRATIERAREATATVKPSFHDEALLPLIQEAGAQLAERFGSSVGKLAFVADVPPTLRADLDRYAFLQALQNFLQNAVEAYPADALQRDVVVTARPRRAGSQVEITVTDRGAGMNEAQQDAMFLPFGSRKPGGTGVGLVIARTMIREVHGGTLTITSARGTGTTVTVVLPAKQAGRAPRAES